MQSRAIDYTDSNSYLDNVELLWAHIPWRLQHMLILTPRKIGVSINAFPELDSPILRPNSDDITDVKTKSFDFPVMTLIIPRRGQQLAFAEGGRYCTE